MQMTKSEDYRFLKLSEKSSPQLLFTNYSLAIKHYEIKDKQCQQLKLENSSLSSKIKSMEKSHEDQILALKEGSPVQYQEQRKSSIQHIDDMLDEFINTRCETGTNFKVSSSDLFRKADEYIKQKTSIEINKHVFRFLMEQKGYLYKRTKDYCIYMDIRFKQ